MPDPPFMARCTRYNIMPWDKFCQWLVTCQWFSPGTPVSSTNKTDHHDITEILLKVALNTINHVCQIWYFFCFKYFTGFLVFKEYCEQLCDEQVPQLKFYEEVCDVFVTTSWPCTCTCTNVCAHVALFFCLYLTCCKARDKVPVFPFR
jgi:hypothetical protein